jgi:hypothetical protein
MLIKYTIKAWFNEMDDAQALIGNKRIENIEKIFQGTVNPNT